MCPKSRARHYRLAPLGVEDGALEVGVTDPDNLEARDALTFISAKVGMPYKIFLITDTDFDKLLKQYKGLSGEVGKALGELETEITVESEKQEKEGKKHSTSLEETEITETETEAITEDAPVTKIVATILRHAAEQRASDIHIEPMADQTRVRFRIDGVLITNITLPPKVHTRGRGAHQGALQHASRRKAQAAGRPLFRARRRQQSRLPRLDLPDLLRREGGDAYFGSASPRC